MFSPEQKRCNSKNAQACTRGDLSAPYQRYRKAQLLEITLLREALARKRCETIQSTFQRFGSLAGGGPDAGCAGVRGEQEQRLSLSDVGRARSAP